MTVRDYGQLAVFGGLASMLGLAIETYFDLPWGIASGPLIAAYSTWYIYSPPLSLKAFVARLYPPFLMLSVLVALMYFQET
jgi:hypothetical protein